jgi:transcriptional regulator with XRE-family HTH domain
MYYGKFEIGKVIRRLRLEKQISLEKVAEHCGVDIKYMSEIEENLHPELNMRTICDIAISFNMRPSDLMEEIEKENADYYRRMGEDQSNRRKIYQHRRRRKKLTLQKETHNFKKKHSIHQSKMKKHF